MRILISTFAALLLATAAGCSKTDDSADRGATDQTSPSTTTPGAPGDVTGGTPDATTPQDDTTMPSDPSTMPPSDPNATTPPDQSTPPPNQ